MSTANGICLVAFKNKTTLVVMSGALILSAAMSIRHTFGLFIGLLSFGAITIAAGLALAAERLIAQAIATRAAATGAARS